MNDTSINYPKQAERVIREQYWHCGIDGCGHYHKTEETAAKCIEKQKLRSESPVIHRDKSRFITALKMRKEGKTYKEISVFFKISTTTARDWMWRAQMEIQRRTLL